MLVSSISWYVIVPQLFMNERVNASVIRASGNIDAVYHTRIRRLKFILLCSKRHFVELIDHDNQEDSARCCLTVHCRRFLSVGQLMCR
jgi:hypothetical protein